MFCGATNAFSFNTYFYRNINDNPCHSLYFYYSIHNNILFFFYIYIYFYKTFIVDVMRVVSGEYDEEGSNDITNFDKHVDESDSNPDFNPDYKIDNHPDHVIQLQEKAVGRNSSVVERNAAEKENLELNVQKSNRKSQRMCFLSTLFILFFNIMCYFTYYFLTFLCMIFSVY